MYKNEIKTSVSIIDKKAKNYIIFATILSVIIYFTLVFLIIPCRAFATNISESKLVELVNQERKTRGLSELSQDPQLYYAAKLKAQDMINKNYFNHYSPNGKSPWDFIRNSGYEYQKAGENLAMDFATSSGIHNAWMASETHKNNILKPDYEHIAIAVLKGNFNNKNTTMVVQMFGNPMPENQYPAQSLIFGIRNFILGF